MSSELVTPKLFTRNQLAEQVKAWQAAGEQVAFTNGCFDLVHAGHIDYLQKTKALANRLVVGLNTDASVSKIKGPTRPVANETSRAFVLAALGCVDAVVFFDEPTPLELIEAIGPDILTKGSDYNLQTIVGADFVISKGGTVQTIDLVPGYSTSALIEKIIEAHKRSSI